MAFAAAHPLEASVKAFIEEHVAPAEAVWLRQRGEPGTAGRWTVVPAVVEELKAKAKAAGLWNLFLPAISGLTQLEYAPLAEVRDTISFPSSIPPPCPPGCRIAPLRTSPLCLQSRRIVGPDVAAAAPVTVFRPVDTAHPLTLNFG